MLNANINVEAVLPAFDASVTCLFEHNLEEATSVKVHLSLVVINRDDNGSERLFLNACQVATKSWRTINWKLWRERGLSDFYSSITGDKSSR